MGKLLGVGAKATTMGLLLLALVSKDSRADLKAGLAAYMRGDYARAFAELSIDASDNNAFAQNVLGTMYFSGLGVERDYKRAVDWFFKAQALGSAEAMANLATMHEAGQGVPQSNATALKYYREAALAGNQAAILRVAEIYEKGELGVAPDAAEASTWRSRVRTEVVDGGRKRLPPTPFVAAADRSAATGTAPPPAPRLPKREAGAGPSALSAALLEKRLLQRLEDYAQRERKLFVASTDNPASAAAYLKELRAQLTSQLGNVFAAAGPEESVVVSLSILKDGALREVELSQKARNPGINARVLAALRKIKHLQPLPSDTAKLADVLVVSVRLPIE